MNAVFPHRNNSLHLRTVLYARPDAPSTVRCQRQDADKIQLDARWRPRPPSSAVQGPRCFYRRRTHAGRVSVPAVLGAVWKHAPTTPPPPPKSGPRAWRRMAAVQWPAARAPARLKRTRHARAVWSLSTPASAPFTAGAQEEPGRRGRPAHIPLLRSRRCTDGNGRPREDMKAGDRFADRVLIGTTAKHRRGGGLRRGGWRHRWPDHIEGALASARSATW